MAIKSKNKIGTEFSTASMSDMIFLLLIFFMLLSTMVTPNALKLVLPKSNAQTSETPLLAVSITADLKFYVSTTEVPQSNLEILIQQKLKGQKDPCISLHADKSVPIDEVVKVMNIARNNKYKLILATSAN